MMMVALICYWSHDDGNVYNIRHDMGPLRDYNTCNDM